ADALVRFMEAKMGALVFDVELLERLVGFGDVLDVHALADFTPEKEHAESFLFAHHPPAEADIPADGLKNERREHIKIIAVGDLKRGGEVVHAPQSPFAAVAIVAPFHELADDNVGVIVALLRPGGEFASFVEQGRNARHAVRAIKSELKRTRGIERELEAGTQ